MEIRTLTRSPAPLPVTQFTRRPAPGAFSIERVFDDVRAAMPDDVAVTQVRNRFLSQGLMPRLRDAWSARRRRARVNHVTGDVHYLTFFLPRARTLLTVHDTVLVDRERGLRRLVLWALWFWLPARRCARMTAISHESKRRILALIRTDPDRITVIPNPVSADFTPQPVTAHDGPFRLLHIGTKANKNLDRLVAALAGLAVELTVVGRPGAASRAALDASGLDLRLLQDLDDAALRAEYARCDALAFVSLDEGFGLPIVEAQATGRPVLTSARAPMDDVAGGAALLVDPTDTDAIRTGVQRLMTDAALRADLVARGHRNVTRFSAATVARAYADLYLQIDREAAADV